MAWLVMLSASADARKATTAATSSARTNIDLPHLLVRCLDCRVDLALLRNVGD
jgi:hypothetical protein